MIDKAQIQRVLDKIQAAETALSDPAVLGNPKVYREKVREHAALRKLENVANVYFRLLDDLEDNRELANDPAGDPEIAEMAREESARIASELPEAERRVLSGLLPPEPADARNAVFEIRAGTGGEEAALFAAVLFRMYSRFCDARGWKISVIDANATELGGYKEVVFTVVGEGAYGTFKFESGGHRVQRVPETEAQGRIHTSACTVAIMAEADELEDVQINPADIRIDTFRASGAGGQHINKTDSAVRIVHLPTGIVVECQDGRSQHKNKAQALSVLAARIRDAQEREQHAKIASERKSLVGSGDRSERIRTYNFPQGRVTDHRINLTLYKIDSIMDGDLDEIIGALTTEHQAEQLAALADSEQ